jgi:FkbM family methyltransferase
MSLLLQASRWFNFHFPWHQLKPSVAKRAARLLDTSRGNAAYEGIQGSLRMRLDLAHPLERDIYLNVSNMTLVSLFRSVLKPGDVAIDGGANLGYLSLVAWQCVGETGRVYAFEAQPKMAERLRENVLLNAAHSIEVVPKALWSEAGSAILFEFDEASHDLPSLGRRPDKQVGREISVETVRIDDVVAGPVRLCKLDIEGAEWSAMKGSQRILFGYPPPHVVIELTPCTSEAFGHHPLQVLDWFLGHGGPRRLHLMLRRRIVTVTRENLVQLFQRQPKKSHNVWFEPV